MMDDLSSVIRTANHSAAFTEPKPASVKHQTNTALSAPLVILMTKMQIPKYKAIIFTMDLTVNIFFYLFCA